MALALVDGAAEQRHGAGAVEPDFRTLIARRAGALDGVGYPEPAQLPALPRLLAARRKAVDIGEAEHPLQLLGEISAVIGACKPGPERQCIGRDPVALPQPHRIAADC